MKKLLAITMTISLSLVLLAGCSGGGTAETKAPAETSAASSGGAATAAPVEYEEVLYVRNNADNDTYNPYGSTSAQHMIYTNSTFDMLIRNDADTGEIIPYLAKEWKDVNGDGKVWDFYLEEGVKFHDGSDFTAEDVKFTCEYASASAKNVTKVITFTNYVESIECPSTYVVRFNLKSAMYDWPTYLESAPIFSKTAFSKMDPAEAATIGCGPYYYDKSICISGVQFGMTRFEDYWGGAENFHTKQIIFKVIAENDTAYAALETGEVDFIYAVVGASYDVLAANKDLEMYSRVGANSYYMGFNYKSGKYDDLKLRKAICQAIDKDAIVDVAYFGGIGGIASYNFCAPSGKGYTEIKDPVKYDKDAAKAALKELGKENLKLTLVHYASCKQIAEVIQANLAEIGVEVTVQQVDTTNWTAFKAAGEGYDIFLDYAAYQGALLYNFDRFFVKGGSSNVYGFYSEEYENLQNNVLKASSYDNMLTEFAVLQEWVAKNIPIFPLTISTQLGAAQKDIEGFVLAPTNNYMDFRGVYCLKRK